MIPSNKPFLLVGLLALGLSVASGSANQIPAKKDRIISLPADAAISEYGTLVLDSTAGVGFVSSVSSGSLISFSPPTGKVLSSLRCGEIAGAPSMIEIGEERLIALPTANNPDGDRPATVSIINATKADQLERVALIILPSDARLGPESRALLTKDGRFGVIASSFKDAALFSFNVETKQVISRLVLYGQPSGIDLSDNETNRTIVVANPMANSVFIGKLDEQGQLSPVGTFIPPDACFDQSNDPEFSADGRKVYIAASKSDRLYIIDAETCIPEASISISCPQRITVARDADGVEIIGVTRLRHPSNGKPCGVTILSTRNGGLTIKAEFIPPDGFLLSRANNVVFSSDASIAFIGSTIGMLLSFNTVTGKLVTYRVIGGELRRLILSQSNRTLLAVRSTLIKDDIAAIDVDGMSEAKPGIPHLPRLMPEIKRVSDVGTYVHLLIEGTNFQKGSIVEFVKADKVVSQQSPVHVTKTQLTIIVPAKRFKELGKFDIRVVTGNKIATDLTTVEPLTLLSNNNIKPIERYSRTEPSVSSASVVRSVHSDVTDNVTRVFIDTDGETKIQTFTLVNPLRVVVDIIGVRNTFGNRTLHILASPIQTVRIGEPKLGVVRVVLDAKRKVHYEVTREGGSIVVAVSDPGLKNAERPLSTR